jgi:GntR family transcriptional regulator
VSQTAGYRPLYRQVYDIVVNRVAKGDWKPGQALPSEQILAQQMGVSQGTMRKVLDALTAEKLLERRQGKGTFIAEYTQERALFRYFRLASPDGGKRLTPASAGETVRLRAARAVDRSKLDLPAGERVVEIARTREIDGRPALYELIVLPAKLFPGIEKRPSLPNTLYSLYHAEYRINIVAAHEELRSELATAQDERVLHVAVGSPILVIDRIAVCLRDRKVEWRLSRVRSGDIVYAVTLT